ncbi:MAG: ABC transporter permease subunit [Propionibacteriaceae bacterium]|nr:ABC transporter permease subunit [Propionibacteriaceae bacterium]
MILAILIMVTVAVVWPILHMMSAAFAPGNNIAGLSIVPFADGFTAAHFEYLLTQTNYPRWFLNTLIVAVCTSAGTLVVASTGAYIFSRFQFAFKRQMLMSMLILEVFPSFVGMIAIYVVLYRFGALDTLWGLVLVYMAGNLPFTIWLVKSYMDNIPRALDEAARIDGASNLRVFSTIILPVSRPILTFLAVTSFAAPWMDFIFPKMVLRSPENQTLALGLFSFVTDKNNDFTNFAAGSLIVAVPFVVFFILTQKSLIASLSSGAMKE